MSKNLPELPKRCVIYTRCAASQANREDLIMQEKICTDFIAMHEKQNWVFISKIYEDNGLSGMTLERPALKELLQDAEKDLFDIVICDAIERFSRELQHHDYIIAELEKHNVSVVFAQDTQRDDDAKIS